jgi:hypothetical protein
MINKDNLKYGDIIWQVDINGSSVMLRKLEIGHLHCIAGSYYAAAGNILIKVDSPHLFYSKSEAIDFVIDLRDNLNKVIHEIDEIE